MPQTIDREETLVTVGVDTHADMHVAATIDQLSRLLVTLNVPTTPAGFRRLVDWASTFGVIDRVGVEGTGSWGAGIARWLRVGGLVVAEVERPDRSDRRGNGKSDPIDAEAAARAVRRAGPVLFQRRPTGTWR